ncbi:hypothetical protein EAM_2106 [Erwinia amylovora ATCC 49946]|uniref:Uncharacterized protein n=1 Tax=Erwinia amylovora NBRC 12687 = CFBP 1232 TaxID=1219359 RepID=A0A831ER47_ERWAM|nr:hypothetical protein EAM_2106 [Erwinia amylovora ATCC 49946]CCO94168.1 hypothetical protein BN437_2245 [Erwinia amylovora NBRC 12687 = CFBP 1232]
MSWWPGHGDRSFVKFDNAIRTMDELKLCRLLNVGGNSVWRLISGNIAR